MIKNQYHLLWKRGFEKAGVCEIVEKGEKGVTAFQNKMKNLFCQAKGLDQAKEVIFQKTSTINIIEAKTFVQNL